MPPQMHPSSWRGKGSDRFPPFITLSAGKRWRLSTVPTPKLLRPPSRRTCHKSFLQNKKKKGSSIFIICGQKELKLAPLVWPLRRYSSWRALTCRRSVCLFVPRSLWVRAKTTTEGNDRLSVSRNYWCRSVSKSVDWWYFMVTVVCIHAAVEKWED